jgi:hypothetical protein
MDIMLSWSGAQSKAIAAALYEWLPTVIPGIVPWMSSEDISKGKRWFEQLLGPLNTCRTCVICLTSQNVQSCWIFFEAGAIASKKDDAHLFTYLVGVAEAAIKGTPLEQYQWTQSERDDTWRLIRDVNRALGDKGHDENLLRSHFDQNWITLQAKLGAVHEQQTREEQAAKEAKVFKPTPQEVEFLTRLASSPEGVVHRVRSDAGVLFVVDGDALNLEGSQREKAAWQSAFDRLFRLRFIEDREQNGERFHLSSQGFDAVEQINAQRAKQTSIEEFADVKISGKAAQLLAHAAKDNNGVIAAVSRRLGTHIQTNGRSFGDPSNARDVAEWEAALRELEDHRFIEPVSVERQVFKVTKRGYEAADQLAPDYLEEPPTTSP